MGNFRTFDIWGWTDQRTLTWNLYPLTSACKFSIPFSIHLQRCWQGEFVWLSKASLVNYHFLYSCNLIDWFRVDVVRRIWLLVTPCDQSIYTNLLHINVWYNFHILFIKQSFLQQLIPKSVTTKDLNSQTYFWKEVMIKNQF